MSPKQRNALIAAVVTVALVAVAGIVWAIQANSGDESDQAGVSTSRGVDDDAATPTGPADPDQSDPDQTETSPDPNPDQLPPADREGEFGLGVGDPAAPVTVEIFEDYQCPFCQQFEEAAHDALMEAAADGSAYVVYRPMAFLSDYSGRALNVFGVVLDLAGGEAALRFHHLLFAEPLSDPPPTDDELIALAVQAGAEDGAVRAGIREQSAGHWVIDASEDAFERGISGTPTVLVDGQPVPGQSIEELVVNMVDLIEAG